MRKRGGKEEGGREGWKNGGRREGQEREGKDGGRREGWERERKKGGEEYVTSKPFCTQHIVSCQHVGFVIEYGCCFEKHYVLRLM